MMLFDYIPLDQLLVLIDMLDLIDLSELSELFSFDDSGKTNISSAVCPRDCD